MKHGDEPRSMVYVGEKLESSRNILSFLFLFRYDYILKIKIDFTPYS